MAVKATDTVTLAVAVVPAASVTAVGTWKT